MAFAKKYITWITEAEVPGKDRCESYGKGYESLEARPHYRETDANGQITTTTCAGSAKCVFV